MTNSEPTQYFAPFLASRLDDFRIILAKRTEHSIRLSNVRWLLVQMALMMAIMMTAIRVLVGIHVCERCLKSEHVEVAKTKIVYFFLSQEH